MSRVGEWQVTYLRFSDVRSTALRWGAALLLCIPLLATAAPSFSDYSAPLRAEQPNHPYVPDPTDQPRDNAVKAQAATLKPMLADHYVVYSLACGTDALCGGILDVDTGEVATLIPGAYLANTDLDERFAISVETGSRLVVVKGIGTATDHDEKNVDRPHGFYTRYYRFDGRELTLLKLESNVPATVASTRSADCPSEDFDAFIKAFSSDPSV